MGKHIWLSKVAGALAWREKGRAPVNFGTGRFRQRDQSLEGPGSRDRPAGKRGRGGSLGGRWSGPGGRERRGGRRAMGGKEVGEGLKSGKIAVAFMFTTMAAGYVVGPPLPNAPVREPTGL